MKKNTYTFNVLVMPYEGGYMSLCKETGLIRQGSTLHEARDAMFSAMQTLINAVCEDQRLEPSLSVGLPFKYKVLFQYTVLKMIASSTMDNLMYEKNSLQAFRTQAVSLGGTTLTAKLGKTKKDDGVEVDAFLVKFTNGTLEQLDELAVFLDKQGLDLPKEDPERKLAVIKIGIALLVGLKDRDKK